MYTDDLKNIQDNIFFKHLLSVDVWTSDVTNKLAILLLHLLLAISFLLPTKGHIKLPSPNYTY